MVPTCSHLKPETLLDASFLFRPPHSRQLILLPIHLSSLPFLCTAPAAALDQPRIILSLYLYNSLLIVLLTSCLTLFLSLLHTSVWVIFLQCNPWWHCSSSILMALRKRWGLQCGVQGPSWSDPAHSLTSFSTKFLRLRVLFQASRECHVSAFAPDALLLPAWALSLVERLSFIWGFSPFYFKLPLQLSQALLSFYTVIPYKCLCHKFWS